MSALMACRVVLSAMQGAMASEWHATTHPSPTELPRMWQATRRRKALWRARAHGNESEHRHHVLSPHGCDAAATCSTAAAAARICTQVSGQWSRAGGGVRASSGVESRCPHDHATGAEPREYSQASIGITCSHLTAAMPHAHMWAIESVVVIESLPTLCPDHQFDW